VAENFAWVHSLASLKHARRLAAHRLPEQGLLDVCIQVNLSGETSKGGITAAQLDGFAEQVAAMPNIRLRGLMTLPNPHAAKDEQRATFRRLRELKERLNRSGLGLDTLSMGMSEDLDLAIREGATWVRVGTAIFGRRE
jgi:pyridoxal phosphate enzyme (YggS family)